MVLGPLQWKYTHHKQCESCSFHSLTVIIMITARGGICQCRHCRRQYKIFASGVNFSIFTHFLCFFSLKLLKLGEIDGVKFLTNSMSDNSVTVSDVPISGFLCTSVQKAKQTNIKLWPNNYYLLRSFWNSFAELSPRTPAILSRKKLIQSNHAYSCFGFGKLFNVLLSRIGREASWGILKHFPHSSCIFISHWSSEK